MNILDKKKANPRKINVYAVKDELTQTFMQPNFMDNDLEITRIFAYQINNTPIWKDNPEDFSLYKLGSFNEDTGEFISKVEKIVSGRSVWKKEGIHDLQSTEQTENKTK